MYIVQSKFYEHDIILLDKKDALISSEWKEVILMGKLKKGVPSFSLVVFLKGPSRAIKLLISFSYDNLSPFCFHLKGEQKKIRTFLKLKLLGLC